MGKEEGIQFNIRVVYDDQADRERRAREQAGAKEKFFTDVTERRLFYGHHSLRLGAMLPYQQRKFAEIFRGVAARRKARF